MIRIGLGLGLSIGGAAGSAPGYYLSAAGNDSNDGLTPATAWLTITKLNSVIVSDGTVLQNIFLRGGDTFSGSILLTGTNPTSQRYIESYGSGHATISCGNEDGVLIDGIGNVTVNRLTFTGSGVSTSGVTTCKAWTAAVKAINTTNTQRENIRVTNCTISGCWDGIDVWSWNATEGDIDSYPTAVGFVKGFTGIRITGNTVSGCAAFGIRIHGKGPSIYAFSNGQTVNQLHQDAVVNDNVVFNTRGYSAAHGVGYGIAVMFTQTAEALRNEVYDNGQNFGSVEAVPGSVGIMFMATRDGAMRWNECRGQNDKTLSDGEGIDFDQGCEDCLAEFNYCHGNAGPGALLYGGIDALGMENRNITYRYNLLVNNGRYSHSKISGFSTFIPVGTTEPEGCAFHNNTVFDDYAVSTASIVIKNEVGSLIFANNGIISRNGGTRYGYLNTDRATTVFGNLWDFNHPMENVFNNSAPCTTLAAMHTAGMEKYLGTDYGYVTDMLVSDPGDETNFFPVTGQTAYDLTNPSPAVGTGLDLFALASIDMGTVDFHGNTLLTDGNYNIGAVAGSLPLGLPTEPANFTATAGDTLVTLAWDPVAGAESYNLYRALTSDGEGLIPIVTGLTDSDAAGYDDTGRTNGVTYYYYVTAVNAVGEGPHSVEDSATPEAPPAGPDVLTGLCAAYKFASGSELVDSSGNGNDLTNVNSVVISGGAATFDNANSQYLTVNDNATISVTNKFTLHARVNFSSQDANQIIANKWLYNTQGGWTLDSNGALGAKLWLAPTLGDGGSVTASVTIAGPAPSTGVDYDIFVVYDGTQTDADPATQNNKRVQIYWNGVKKTIDFGGTTIPSTILDNTAPLQLGKWNGIGWFLDATIKQFDYWNVPFGQDEVDWIYNGGTVREHPYT